jgi:cytochrome c-type biogenesis protein CcsB
MEQFSYNMFILGFALTAGASVGYVLRIVWPRVAYRAAATQAGSVTVASRAEPPAWLDPVATAASWLAVAVLTASLGGRWAAVGHPPLTNMWEYTVGFGWGIVLFYVLFEWRYRQRTLGAFVMPVALALFIVSTASFPSRVEPLVPALQANRLLAAHVGTMMLSYAALAVSFGAAVMYLLQGEERRIPRLPSAEVLEEIGHKSVLVGFPLLALGIGLGAYWADSAWGRYWGWDPKETSALVTWLIYAGYLHARELRGWRGRRAAIVLVMGFLAVLFTFFAVNLWVSGLHSYSGV